MNNDYFNHVANLRRKKRLHSAVQERLGYLLEKRFGASCAVPEVSHVPGGRNDLMLFECNGRRVCFEIFASVSQVPQDLRLLEQANADVCIAVLLDREVDRRVSTEYFRKKPHPFPFFWIRDFLDPAYEQITIARLTELIDESSSLNRLRRILSNPRGSALEEPLAKAFASLEEKVGALPPATDISKLTGVQVFALLVIAEIHKLGVPPGKLRSLYEWLQQAAQNAVILILAGFQAFLITNLNGQHAIWSDGDLADDLIMGAYAKSDASIVMCLNQIFYKATGKSDPGWEGIGWHFFHSYTPES